jgi:hypothetical protein
MQNKIISVVKFNDGEAFVLKEKPKMVYTKYGKDTIIGTDGIFYIFFGFEYPTPRREAFSGRAFDIQLETGEVIKCSGQWWDKITKRAIDVLGINDTDNKIVYATANSLDKLKECYVFTGYKSLSSKIEEFRKSYTGKVYDYWEYEKIVKNGI